MAETPPNPSPAPAGVFMSGPDRPRRREIVLVSALGVAVLTTLLFAGALDLTPFFAASAALCALAFIYYLTALTTTAPVSVHECADPEAVARGETALAMLERAAIPILLIGPGGRIEQANLAARAFFGLSAEGGLLSNVLRQPSVLEAVAAAMRGEKRPSVSYSTLAPEESHVRAFVEPIAVAGAEAPTYRAMLALMDETNSKRAERMRADFLANASHELRTPLASLAGFIETLSGHARDDLEAHDHFLRIMREQTERMRRLIDDLLSLSRVEMNEHVRPSGQVDLAGIAKDVVAALEPVAQSRSVRLSLEGGEARVLVEGDRDQLYEVVENLAENAIKYSHEGGAATIWVGTDLSRDRAEHSPERMDEASARLTLAAPALSATARYGVIRVRDTGAGIDRRYLPRLSERFFRVEGQKSGPKSGTGLGLAIVKHIVNRHRGGLTVESAPGAGSVFSVFFLQAQTDTAHAAEPLAEAAE